VGDGRAAPSSSAAHKRIGFIQYAFSVPWVFHRHHGYLQG
jgi:hypothetical protein